MLRCLRGSAGWTFWFDSWEERFRTTNCFSSIVGGVLVDLEGYD